MKKKVYKMDDIIGKGNAAKMSPYRQIKEKEDTDGEYNPYKKRNTALREMPRTSKLVLISLFRPKT